MFNKNDVLMFLDVESMGLYGEAFSYGYVVTSKRRIVTGKQIGRAHV